MVDGQRPQTLCKETAAQLNPNSTTPLFLQSVENADNLH